MKKLLAILALLTACLVLVGCNQPPKAKQGANASETAPLHEAKAGTDAATATADTKTADAGKANDERDSKVKANVEHAQETAKTLPDSTQKTVIVGDLGVVLALLDDVTADPLEKVARARDQLLVESGKAAEAQSSYAKAADQGRKDATRITLLETEAAQAIKERDMARDKEAATLASVDARLESNRLETERKMKAIYDEAQKTFYKRLTWGLILGTVALLAIGAFLAYGKFNAGEPGKAAVVAGFFGGAGGFCAVLAWLINQQWFQNFIMWTVIGGTVLGFIAATIFVMSELKSARERKQLDKDATEGDSTLLKLYDTLEEALPPEQLAKVTQTAKGKLNDNEKAYINELKAIRQRAKAAGVAAAV